MKTRLLALLLLAGCSLFARTHVFVGVGFGGYGGYGGYVAAPPPPVYTYASAYVPPCPGPDYSWVSGYWYPVRTHYYWRTGYWVRRPYYRARWVRPRYYRSRYYYGHWR